jgi:hypothetical protein
MKCLLLAAGAALALTGSCWADDKLLYAGPLPPLPAYFDPFRSLSSCEDSALSKPSCVKLEAQLLVSWTHTPADIRNYCIDIADKENDAPKSYTLAECVRAMIDVRSEGNGQ